MNMRFHRIAACLLALVAGLALANAPARALPRETPLQVARQIEAQTSGGDYDPGQPAATTTPITGQRDARAR